MIGATPETWMRRAIELSRRGFPAPNPHVGCVIVRGGRIVGEGWHDHAGGPHAERVALDHAGDAARGADVYVTLEPCAHHGRTPPCADALIAAGVARVIVACADPNPRASGGAARLRDAGKPVETGLLEAEAAEANATFLAAHRLGRPFVTLKAAITLDGFIARPDGMSQWITGPAAREEGHRLRADMGVVLVGRRTVEQDDPQLTARLAGVVNPPLRVVLDPQARLTGAERVFGRSGESWHVVLEGHATGPAYVPCPGANGTLDLGVLLALLRECGHIGVLVEGGAATLRAFLDTGFCDEIHLFQAPITFGEGLRWLPGDHRLDRAFVALPPAQVGPDLHLRWRANP